MKSLRVPRGAFPADCPHLVPCGLEDTREFPAYSSVCIRQLLVSGPEHQADPETIHPVTYVHGQPVPREGKSEPKTLSPRLARLVTSEPSSRRAGRNLLLLM